MRRSGEVSFAPGWRSSSCQKELKKRARAGGLDEDAVDDVDDAVDPKAAIIELLVAAAAPAPEQMLGASVAQMVSSEPEPMMCQ